MPGKSTKRIKGLTPEDHAILIGRALSNSQKIWKALEQNPGLVNSLGLPDDAAKDRVRRALGARAKKESESIMGNRFIDHIPDLLFVALVTVIVAAIIRVDRRHKPVVVALKPIAPFHVIDATDVKVRYAADSVTARREQDSVLGRYSTQQIRSGAVVKAAKLSSGVSLGNELDGLDIFTLRVRPTSILAGRQPPFRLGVFLSPSSTENRGKAQLFSVYLLDSRPEGDNLSVVIAATKDDAATLLSVRSAGDLIAVGPVR